MTDQFATGLGDEDEKSAQEQAAAALALADKIAFRDRNGTVIRPGYLVRYEPPADQGRDRVAGWSAGMWTDRRWGVVIGLARTPMAFGGDAVSVRVHAIDVSDDESRDWSKDWWTCEPGNLVVLVAHDLTAPE
jgi:hypothetical protein